MKYKQIAIRRDGKSLLKPPFLNLVFILIRYHGNIETEQSEKIIRNFTKIIGENNNRCTVNDYIFECSFILFIFVKNHLLVISDEIVCTGYTIFANTLICECTYSEIIANMNAL